MHSLLLLRFLMTLFFESITYYQVIVHCLKIFLPFFQAHVAESATIADHCSMYALSDSKESPFKSTCNHSHDKRCMQCETLKDVLEKVENCFVDCEVSPEELDDLTYSCRQAVDSIKGWKAHQLRSCRQDEARTSILNTLDERSVHVTQDWAMKFLPQKYRESQSDWFGKRGISWHISVVARKMKQCFQHQAFVHVLENCKQDSYTVVRIIEHTLRTLKHEHPELTTAFLRQDNAGCYHSAEMLANCAQMESKTGIPIRRVDFSDPQGGKGPCDRKAATVKAHVRRYINEGHDVLNANDFLNAMLSNGGIPNVRAVIADAYSTERDAQLSLKWSGVNSLNNFLYSEKTITVWKAYNNGEGKKVPGTQNKWGKVFFIYSTYLKLNGDWEISIFPSCTPIRGIYRKSLLIDLGTLSRMRGTAFYATPYVPAPRIEKYLRPSVGLASVSETAALLARDL